MFLHTMARRVFGRSPAAPALLALLAVLLGDHASGAPLQWESLQPVGLRLALWLLAPSLRAAVAVAALSWY